MTFNTIVVEPYIARIGRERLLRTFVGFVLLAMLGCVPILLVAFLWPQGFLWILGAKYAGLRGALGWYMLSACMNFVSGLIWIMNRARKWVFWSGSFLEVVLLLGVQLAFFILIGVRTTRAGGSLRDCIQLLLCGRARLCGDPRLYQRLLIPLGNMASDVAAHHAALLQILLVVLLGLPEVRSRRHLGHDRRAKGSRCVQLRDLCPCRRGLFLRMREDHAAVLRAPVRALPVQLRGIVQREKRIQQSLVADRARCRTSRPRPPHAPCDPYKPPCRSGVRATRPHTQRPCPARPSSRQIELPHPKNNLRQTFRVPSPRRSSFASHWMLDGLKRSATKYEKPEYS